MSPIRHTPLIFLTIISLYSYSQKADSSLKTLQQLPDKYYSKVDNKLSSIDNQLTKKTTKYIQKLERQERKIQGCLNKINPETAKKLFAASKEKYTRFSQQIKSKTAKAGNIVSGQYNAYLDTLTTSLSFLQQFKGISDKVKQPFSSLQQLQRKLQESEKIKQYVSERKEQIKQLLSKYTKLPGSLHTQYDKFNKTAYYYSAQINEYKEMLKDSKKREQKTLGILRELPAFQKFMKENGQLASLFRINENLDPVQSLAGLQTRISVQGLVQQRVAAGGPNALQIIQQNIAQAINELDKLKDKINQFGGGSSDIEIPDFKPNHQKTKKFLQRLEYTTDVQFAKTNNLIPFAANIGLGLGYKLNDKSSLGIGMSYNLGIGSIQHISFTSQGLGLRSYMDWKIKKQFYVSGGYEMNYNTAFKNIEQLKNYNAWQRSALLGVSKKYKISKKVQGKMKLLYDFFANRHIPATQPFLFRVGYNLK